MIYKEVTLRDFNQAFDGYYTEDGIVLIYDYLSNAEYNTELDIVAIKDEFAQEPLQEVLGYYGLDSLDELEGQTLVLGLTNDLDNKTDDVVYISF